MVRHAIIVSLTSYNSVPCAWFGGEIFVKFTFFVAIFISVCRLILLRRDVWPFISEISVHFEPFFYSRLGIRLYRIDRTFRLADATIDAFIRMNDQHVVALVEAIHGANLHTIGEFAFDAVLVDDERHASQLLSG
jgi:hypothetical protein